MSEQDLWLIVKRGLYFRPDCLGYTGIRDNAGRYSHDFAKKYEGDGVTIVRLADAPEFTEAAYHDLVIKHLQDQRDAARAQLASAKEEIELANQKREFAEFEWNRATEHAQKRDAQLASARKALEDILEYSGGADSALEDEYVMDRARSVLKDLS